MNRRRLFSLFRYCALLCVIAGSLFGQNQFNCSPQGPVTIACLTLITIGQALGATGSPPLGTGTGQATGNAFLVVPLAAAQPVPSPAAGFIYTFDPNAG